MDVVDVVDVARGAELWTLWTLWTSLEVQSCGRCGRRSRCRDTTSSNRSMRQWLDSFNEVVFLVLVVVLVLFLAVDEVIRIADVARGADVNVANFSLGCRCCCRWIRYSRKNTVGEKPVLLINAVTSIATWLWSYRGSY